MGAPFSRKGRGQAVRELRKEASHGTAIMAWGRLWALVLLVAFSAGALVTLAGVPLQHIATAIEQHQPVNMVEAIASLSILALVIGMDLAMVIAAMMIRAFRARGKGIGEWWGYLLIMAFVALSESVTFAVMIVNNEHPRTWVDWLLVFLRALGVPVCAVFLSLVGNLPITPNDVRAKLQIEAGNGLMAYLEHAIETGNAEASALFAFFGLVNDTAAMNQPGWETRVQEALARLSPDAVRTELEQRAQSAEQRLAETTQRLTTEKNELIARANQQINAAQEAGKAQAIEMTSRALTSLLAGGTLPDWLTEARPELSDITLGKRPVARGKAGGIPTTKAPQSRPDAMRFFLHSQGISPAKAPDKMRGIWIKSSDIPALSGEHKLPESPTKLAERLGKAANKGGDAPRDGTAYIARLDDVMSQLIAYHCVDDTVLQSWANVPQSGGDSGDNATVIPFDSRRQA